MHCRSLPPLIHVLGFASCLFLAGELSAQTVFTPVEVHVTSTAGLVNVTSASGMKITNLQVPTASGEKPTTATHRPGAVIETGPDSQATASIPGAGSMLLGSETQVRLPKAGDKSQSLELLKGKLFLNISAEEVKKQGEASFRLKTPAALLAVKGTKFFAYVEKDQETVGVYEGQIGTFTMASRQLNDIKSGNALKTVKGKPEPVRPLTADERRETINYELAASEGRITNSLGMKFAAVPGTKVLFCIHETRMKDFAEYAKASPTSSDMWKQQMYIDGTKGGLLEDPIPQDRLPNHPVNFVSWEQATAFCKWLGGKERREYRLPTDEEWSYAVGLGRIEKRNKATTPERLNMLEDRLFPWGGSYPPKTEDRAGNYGDATWKKLYPNLDCKLERYDDGYALTAPVMSSPPNALGIYDLGGNVVEWCEDWFNDQKTYRTLRGSGYTDSYRGGLLSSCRFSYGDPIKEFDEIGFRIVLESQ